MTIHNLNSQGRHQPSEASAMAPRQSVKQRGRPSASEALRSRCLEQARANRDALFQRLRGDPSEFLQKVVPAMPAILYPNDYPLDLRSLAREAVLDSREMEGWLDEDSALALEEEIYAELCDEEKRLERLAQEEAEQLEEQQNAEDAALYEQHILAGVCCPLCGLGRLALNNGQLLCSDCEMQTQLMDEEVRLEQVAEFLYLAELRHDQRCVERGRFEIMNHCGERLLVFSCKTCGWQELVF